MLAYIGQPVTAEALLARWERDVGAVPDRTKALHALANYIRSLAPYKVGNILEVRYTSHEGIVVSKVRDNPPANWVARLPE
jgi:hypothetical protein